MPISGDQFRKVLSHFATGITVVTAKLPDGSLFGFTVNAFSSVSLLPPLVLFCVGNGGTSFTSISQAVHFSVNFLSESQEAVSITFSGTDPDRFIQVEHRPGTQGSPLIAGCLGYLECRKVAAHPAGDHTIIVGKVLEAEVAGGRPLLYYQSGYQRLQPAY
jgi:flavin reductase (DIM6/NTAB) family NADH-FMN oxidoreductase RutF